MLPLKKNHYFVYLKTIFVVILLLMTTHFIEEYIEKKKLNSFNRFEIGNPKCVCVCECLCVYVILKHLNACLAVES